MGSEGVRIRTDLVRIFSIILLLAVLGVSGLFYYRINRLEVALVNYKESYTRLIGDYTILQEMYTNLSSDYNSLYEMYTDLRDESINLQEIYSSLRADYASLQETHSNLKREYEEIFNLEKETVLEKDMTLNISEGENATLSYDIPYAGYIEMEFTASSDVFFWIGSSITKDVYYSRYPPFPQTLTNGTFRVPVPNTTYLFASNPNPEQKVTINLMITLTY